MYLKNERRPSPLSPPQHTLRSLIRGFRVDIEYFTYILKAKDIGLPNQSSSFSLLSNAQNTVLYSFLQNFVFKYGVHSKNCILFYGAEARGPMAVNN